MKVALCRLNLRTTCQPLKPCWYYFCHCHSVGVLNKDKCHNWFLSGHTYCVCWYLCRKPGKHMSLDFSVFLSMWLKILLKMIVHMNYCTQTMRWGLFFHMQSIDHHTLVKSYLDMFGSWQKTKIMIQSFIKINNKKTLKSLSQLSCCSEG